MLKYLLDEGCNPNLVDMYGQSPLHIAALSGNLPAIKLLYQGEYDLLSVLVNLKYLLDEGCNPNLVDMYGQSPLHIAALSGNLPAIRLLYQGESAILSVLVNLKVSP